MKISDIVPPNPRPVALIGNPMHTKLSQVLKHHIFSLVPFSKILLWIRCTVPSMVDALRLALVAKDKSLRTVPSYIMWCELSVAQLLENLGVALEVLHKVHLLITTSPTLIIAVSPELILDPLIWVGH